MASAKYGRLFTERDVEKILDELGEFNPAESLASTLRKLEAKGQVLRFPADEPLFLLRGKDPAAPPAICSVGLERYMDCTDYYDCAAAVGAGNSTLDEIRDAANEMRAYQERHHELVKIPD